MPKNRSLLILILILIIGVPLLALGFNLLNKIKKQEIPRQAADNTFQLALYCPTIDEFCDKGQTVTKDNIDLGFGGSVPANTPVKASFNGKITTSIINLGSEQVSVIYLDNEEGQIRAIYTFKGSAADVAQLTGSQDTYIKVGTEIGKITGNMTTYNTSLLFTLIKGDPQTGEKLLLDSKSFY